MPRGRSTGIWLYGTAVALTAVLTFEMVYEAHASSPVGSPARYVRRGVEYSLLTVVYFLWLFRGVERLRGPDRGDALGPDTERRDVAPSTYARIVRPALVFLALAWIASPMTTDVYFYLQHGLIVARGLNPYTTRAGDFESPLSPLLGWRGALSYGPVSLAIFWAAARAVPLGVPSAVYVYKGFCVIGHLLNGYLVWKGLPRCRARGLVASAYLVNPMLLFDQVGNGHTEVFLNTSLIVLVLCLRRAYDLGCTLAILAGILTKIVAVVWLPLYLVFLVRSRRWGSLSVAAALLVATAVALTSTLLPTRESWGRLHNPDGVLAAGSLYQVFFTTRAAGSLHQIFLTTLEGLRGLLPEVVTRHRAGAFLLFKLATSAAYCALYAALLWRFYRGRQDATEELICDLGWATVALFLLAAPWYQPWYATALLPLVALNLHERFFTITAMTFAVSGSIAYYVLAYASERLPLLAVSLLTVVPTAGLVVLGISGGFDVWGSVPERETPECEPANRGRANGGAVTENQT